MVNSNSLNPTIGAEQLKTARQTLRSFLEFVEKLEPPRLMLASSQDAPEDAPEDALKHLSFEPPTFASGNVKKLEELTRETLEKLSAPTLRLAFIGATSSGKSTLVNALIGRAIVPTEAGEMSAGVVKIFDADRDDCELSIQAPSSSTDEVLPSDLLWEGVEREATSDKDVYDRLQQIMFKYHKIKLDRSDIIAPDVEIKLRNMLTSEADGLALPSGVKLEIIDLPGIKEINDASNLNVVQNSLKRAVLVIVLNYEDASGGPLATLLAEVAQVINTFRNANTVFFVLNKIDRWTTGDLPIPDRVELLRDKVAPICGLDAQNVDISPIKALQLFLYRVAYGADGAQDLTDRQIIYLATALAKAGVVDDVDDENEALVQIVDDKHLRAIAKLAEALEKNADASGQTLTDEKRYKCQDKLNALLEDFRENSLPAFLAPDIRDELLKRAKDQSGGNRLLKSLTQRIEGHFSQLVIQPIVHEWQVAAQETLNQLRSDAAVAIELAKEKIAELIDIFEKTLKELTRTLNDIQDGLKDSFEDFTTGLKTKNFGAQIQAIKKVEDDQFLAALVEIPLILDGIKQTATQELFLKTVGYYLGGNLDADTTTLAQELKNLGCATHEAGEFAILLEKIREFYEKYPDGKVKIDRNKEPYRESEILGYEELFREAGFKATKLLGTFFTFKLQEKASVFEKLTIDVQRRIRKEMYDAVVACGLGEEIANGIVPTSEYITKATELKFDDSVLRFPTDPGKTAQVSQVQVTYRKNNFIKRLFGAPKFYPVETTVDYWILNLPTAQELVENWDGVSAEATVGMCVGLSGWLEQHSKEIVEFLKTQIKSTIKEYIKWANGALGLSKEEAEKFIKAWEDLLAKCDDSWAEPMKKIERLITDEHPEA